MLQWFLLLVLSHTGIKGDEPPDPTLFLRDNTNNMLTRPDPWHLLPDNMEDFCPSKNICPERNVTQQFDTRDIAPKYKRCCEECSCDDACGEEGNSRCCYRKPDDPAFMKGVECIFPTTYRGSSIEFKYTSFYMMTDSLSETKDSKMQFEDVNHYRNDTACGDIVVAPWGSMYPVYSERTKRIYKNRICAADDGAGIVIEWSPILACPLFDMEPDGVFVFTLSQFDLKHNYIYPECYMDFIAPKKIRNDIEQLVCYKDAISTCPSVFPESVNTLPKNITETAIRQLCESGFYSPYILIGFGLYANVFCLICAYGYAEQRECTTDDKTAWFSAPLSHTVSLLLNVNLIPQNVDTPRVQPPLACPKWTHDSSSCRPVLCPSGQIYDLFGECQFPFIWSRIQLEITLSLTPTHPISTDQLKQFSKSQRLLTSWLKSPWDIDWVIERVFVLDIHLLETKYDKLFPRVLVDMRYKRKYDLNPKLFISTVSFTLNKPWSICMPDTGCIGMIQDISAFREMQIDPNDLAYLIPYWFHRSSLGKNNAIFQSDTNIPKTVKYYLLFQREKQYVNAVQVRKTLSCQLIELHDHEIDMITHDIIFYKNQSKYLLRNEIDRIKSNKGHKGGYSRRICLDDAGFEIVLNAAPSAPIGYSMCMEITQIQLSMVLSLIAVFTFSSD